MFRDILGQVVAILVDLPDGMSGGLLDLVTKLRGPNGPLLYQRLLALLRQKGIENPYLQKISEGKLRATDGKRTLCEAKETFGAIDSLFWQFVFKGPVVAETPFEVYELVKDGGTDRVFEAFGVEMERLCFTQDQILAFVDGHPDLLHPEDIPTMFMFRAKDRFHVACVLKAQGDMPNRLKLVEFSQGLTHLGEGHHRFVIPQLCPPL